MSTQREVWNRLPPLPGTPGVIELPARDLAMAYQFYSSIFPSWQLIDQVPHHVTVDTPAHPIVILEHRVESRRPGGPIIYFEVNELESSVARLLAAGGQLESPIRAVPAVTGVVAETASRLALGHYVKARDLDGTVIGLWQPS